MKGKGQGQGQASKKVPVVREDLDGFWKFRVWDLECWVEDSGFSCGIGVQELRMVLVN